MFTPDDENGYSYFLKYDLVTDVVACPGIEFVSLKDSHYVSREEVFGPNPDEYGNKEIEELLDTSKNQFNLSKMHRRTLKLSIK